MTDFTHRNDPIVHRVSAKLYITGLLYNRCIDLHTHLNSNSLTSTQFSCLSSLQLLFSDRLHLVILLSQLSSLVSGFPVL